MLDNVIDLLLTADSVSIELATLVQQSKELSGSGLSPKSVAETLALKDQREKKGVALTSLTHLIDLIKSYGHPDQIITAVTNYTSLTQIEEKIAETKVELESLAEQLISGHQELDGLETKSTQLKEPLRVYEKAVELGFTEDELARLPGLANKYGGAKEILEAVEAYTSYSDILNKTTNAKAKLGEIMNNIDKLETQYAHLKTATTMCQTLIQQYRFGIDGITIIFSVAKKYGEPLDALKGVEAYGKLQTVQQELGKLEGEVAERKQLLTQLEGKVNEVMSQLESLNAMAMKAGAEVSKVESRLDESEYLQKVVNLLNDPASASYNEHGPLVVAMVQAVLKWVSTHEKHFLYPHSMKVDTSEPIKGA